MTTAIAACLQLFRSVSPGFYTIKKKLSRRSLPGWRKSLKRAARVI